VPILPTTKPAWVDVTSNLSGVLGRGGSFEIFEFKCSAHRSHLDEKETVGQRRF
jgi:hypothetical protein